MSEDVHIYGVVTRDNKSGPIEHALVCLEDESQTLDRAYTDEKGRFRFRLPCAPAPRAYHLRCKAFGVDNHDEGPVEVPASDAEKRAEVEKLIDLKLGLEIQFKLHQQEAGGVAPPASYAVVGQVLLATVESAVKSNVQQYRWPDSGPARVMPIEEKGAENEAIVTFLEPGEQMFTATIIGDDGVKASVSRKLPVAEAVRTVRLGGRVEADGRDYAGRVKVTMERPDSFPRKDELLVGGNPRRSALMAFPRYQDFVNRTLQLHEDGFLSGGLSRRLGELGARGLGVYRTLRELTELFVLSACGSISQERIFPDERIERELRPDRRESDEIDEQLRP